jgi:hypothetical protein
MARIPERELERLKRETDLVALVKASGVALKKRGADWARARRAGRRSTG